MINLKCINFQKNILHWILRYWIRQYCFLVSACVSILYKAVMSTIPGRKLTNYQIILYLRKSWYTRRCKHILRAYVELNKARVWQGIRLHFQENGRCIVKAKSKGRAFPMNQFIEKKMRKAWIPIHVKLTRLLSFHLRFASCSRIPYHLTSHAESPSFLFNTSVCILSTSSLLLVWTGQYLRAYFKKNYSTIF